MDGTLELFLVEFLLNGLNLLQGDGFAGLSFEDQKAQRADLKHLWIWVGDFRRGGQFTPQGMLYDGLESRPTLGRNRLGLSEESVVQFQSRFQIWVNVWVYGCLSIYTFSSELQQGTVAVLFAEFFLGFL